MSMSINASPDGTYGEILVNGAVVAKLPVSGNAVIPGLVGTVSQSGGIPTGAIIERGSNANGEYIRLADGTQICRSNDILLSSFINDRRYQGVWTYPASFVAGIPPTVVHTTGLNHWFAMGFNPDLVTGTTVEQASATSILLSQQSAGTFVAGKSTKQFVVAIGRWF